MNKIDSAYFIEFAEHGDERGNLVVVEGERDVPLAIQPWQRGGFLFEPPAHRRVHPDHGLEGNVRFQPRFGAALFGERALR